MGGSGSPEGQTVKKSLTDLVGGVVRAMTVRPRAPEGLLRRADAFALGGRGVRLIEAPVRPPVTPVERLTVAALKQDGVMPFNRLLEQVALDLYREVLRQSAWVLDLGLFGSDLFVSDVARGLEAGHGILWEIETTEHAR